MINPRNKSGLFVQSESKTIPTIELAKVEETSKILAFLKINLLKSNPSYYNDEFFCEDGTRAAIRKNNAMIAKIDNEIVGFVRFYKRKKQKRTSIYQFVVSPEYRGLKIMKHMFEKIKRISGTDLESKCLCNDSMNEYYSKNGWEIDSIINGYNIWIKKVNE